MERFICIKTKCYDSGKTHISRYMVESINLPSSEVKECCGYIEYKDYFSSVIMAKQFIRSNIIA